MGSRDASSGSCGGGEVGGFIAPGTYRLKCRWEEGLENELEAASDKNGGMAGKKGEPAVARGAGDLKSREDVGGM